MRLLDFLRDKKLDDEAFASRLGDCSGHAVKKWKYGEREPDAVTITRIERATIGAVTLRDWADQAEERRAKRLAAPTTSSCDTNLSTIGSAHA